MDDALLDSGSGDAIARDWELPELPSGSASLHSTPSLPTSQELAEIFGNSDDEDDDFPFPLSGGLSVGGGSATMESLQDSQQGQGAESLFSSLMGTETAESQLQTGLSGAPPAASSDAQAPAPETGGTSTKTSNDGGHPAPQRKSARISSRQVESRSEVKMEDTKTAGPQRPAETKISEEKPKTPEKGTPKFVTSAAATNSKTTNKKDKEAVVEVAGVGEGREGEEKEGEGREEEEESDNEEEEEEESISDDPDRLWCVCRKPHNDRFMICCDLCEEWFHGDCVGISVSQGRRMERAGKEYICPVCTERTKLEKEIKSASRMARQAKREEMREARQKSEKRGKDHHRKRSLSGSYSSSGVAKEGGDNYGIDLLFQPDNAPPITPPNSGPQDSLPGERRGGEERRKRSFYRIKEESESTTCIAPQCSAYATPPSLYCSDTCIEKYSAESLKNLASRGITFETDPSEFVRGSKGISMVDKATGKTVIGIQAPTDKTLVAWLKQHPSYQVLLPSGKHGRDVRPKRLKVEGERGGEQEGRRQNESPSKHRSLNDPETVRMNAKKALYQTLWKRKEAVDDVVVTQEQVEKIANQIEVKLYNLHGDINTKYKTKYRSLLFNLKDTKNQGLFRKVCLGQISPSELVKMKSEQYASDQLAEWREKTLKKDLDKIVEREEEEGSSKKVIRKITYKGEVEIEAEKTEAIETIAPPEEAAVTPSTPLTPNSASKATVQSADGAKPSDSGAGKSEKQDAPKSKVTTAPKQDAPKTKPNKDKPKSTTTSKSEPSDTKSAPSKETEVGEEKTGGGGGGGGVLDLLMDTTAEHGKHIYHPQCQVCLGKKSPPPPPPPPPPPQMDSSHEEDGAHASGTDMEEMQTDSLPPAIPLLWEGLVDMPGTVAFTSSVYPVSGSTEYITTVLPATLHVMGRIANVQVWDYIDKLQASTTREIVVLRFDWTEEDRDGYEGMLNYLVRKCRCGVIDEHLLEVKDFYLVPLMVDQEVPHQLLPFSGPGLPDDRPNLLLGIVVQTRGVQPAVPPDFSLRSSQPQPQQSSSGSLKRHWSTSSDDPESSTAPKRKRRQQQTIGFGGETPPPLENDDDSAVQSKSLEKGGQKGETVPPVSFYGEHQSNSNSSSPMKKATSAAMKPPPSGIKSILSQLSDEKLKELASAMSNIEESTATAAKSAEVATSTITSPATGQMVTTSPFSGPTHSAPAAAHRPSDNPAESSVQPHSGGADRQQQARFHQTPNLSQLQRPPLHPNTYGPSGGGEAGGGQHQNQSYGSPHSNDQRQFGQGAPPQGGYNAPWGPPNAQPQAPFHPQGNEPYRGGPPNSGPPPHQYPNPQQYPGGPPPNQYSAPPPHHGSPHQYPGTPPQPSGHQYHPPNPHGQYPNPPQQYSGNGPPSSAYPPQNYDSYQNQHHHHHQGYNNRGGNRGWSQDVPGPHHSHYYDGGEARLNDLETRDYGHRSQPHPLPSWRERERGRDRHGWKQERHNYNRGRDRR